MPKASLWEKPEKKKKEPTGKLFPNVLNRVSIGDFEFINATFLLSNCQQTDEYLFEIDSLSIIIKDVYMDSSTIANPIPLNFSDIDINTSFNNITGNSLRRKHGFNFYFRDFYTILCNSKTTIIYSISCIKYFE